MRIRVGGRYLALMHGTIGKKFSEVAIWFKIKIVRTFQEIFVPRSSTKSWINTLGNRWNFEKMLLQIEFQPKCEAVTVFAKEKRRRRVIFYVWIHILTFSQNYAIPSLAGWAEWQQRGGGGAGILGRRAGGGISSYHKFSAISGCSLST